MPFGLQGAATTFQWLMNTLLNPHHQYTPAYTDDIIIYSPTWEDHLQHLRVVLKALQVAGLKANLEKCKLAVGEVTYLGYSVGDSFMKLVVDKMQALPCAPSPQ